MGILEKANRTQVSPELLGEAMEIYANMPPEDRSVLDARLIRVFDFLRAKGFTGRREADLAAAVNFRLTALARIVQSSLIQGRTLSDRGNPIPEQADVLVEAAAKETLVEDDDGCVAFDAGSFERRIVQLARSRRQA